MSLDLDYGPVTGHAHDPRTTGDGWNECPVCVQGVRGEDTCDLCAGEGGWDDEGMPISRADHDRRIDREADDYAASRYEDRRSE